ncbi:hypothetical protein CHARACLAT_018054 [Characodon lateralis]|uniref:Uncharacterized protein n=1 Tax=Characodon lateralis TaxID=208331 RepID=A0ABU7CP68_9TELE|nr:hypothetical protein [Characodon lateralis]
MDHILDHSKTHSVILAAHLGATLNQATKQQNQPLSPGSKYSLPELDSSPPPVSIKTTLNLSTSQSLFPSIHHTFISVHSDNPSSRFIYHLLNKPVKLFLSPECSSACGSKVLIKL